MHIHCQKWFLHHFTQSKHKWQRLAQHWTCLQRLMFAYHFNVITFIIELSEFFRWVWTQLSPADETSGKAISKGQHPVYICQPTLGRGKKKISHLSFLQGVTFTCKFSGFLWGATFTFSSNILCLISEMQRERMSIFMTWGLIKTWQSYQLIETQISILLWLRWQLSCVPQGEGLLYIYI